MSKLTVNFDAGVSNQNASLSFRVPLERRVDLHLGDGRFVRVGDDVGSLVHMDEHVAGGHADRLCALHDRVLERERRYLARMGVVRLLVVGAFAGSCWLAISGGTSTGAQADRPEGLIVFEGNDGLYVIDADGSRARKIPGTTSRDADPAWSPDGRQIAFDRGPRYGFRDIYVMNADGSDQRRLTFAPRDDGWPRWAPHGRAITFESTRDGFFVPHVISLTRGQARRIARNGSYPDWTRSRRIVFRAPGDDVVSVLPYGAGHRVEVRSTRDVTYYAVRVSHDDQRIVFTKHESAGGSNTLSTARRDGSDRKLLWETTLEIETPVWSPDGRWIAFTARPPGTGLYDLYVVRADGTDLTRLTNLAPSPTACCPDWSVTARR